MALLVGEERAFQLVDWAPTTTRVRHMKNSPESDQERWLFAAIDRSYERLHGAYKHFDESITVERFAEGFIRPVVEEGLTGAEMYVELFPEPRGSGHTHADEKMVIVALAYTTEAQRLLHAGELLMAWNRLIDASFWCGAAVGTGALDKAADATDKRTRTEIGQTGQQGRQAGIERTKQKAIEVERRLRPETGRWPSRAVAARVVWKTLEGELVEGDHRPKEAAAAEDWLVSRCFPIHPDKDQIFKPTAVRK